MNRKSLLKAISVSALALTALGSVATTAKADSGERPERGILTVEYSGRGQVRLQDANGHYVNQYVHPHYRFKFFATKVVNGKLMYRIGNQNQWIPAEYSYIPGTPSNETQRAQSTQNNQNTPAPSGKTSGEKPYSGVASIVYNGRGKVRLLNADGHYVDQYLSNGTAWKVFGVKTINGQVMYRVGTQSQWVPAKFTNLPSSLTDNNNASQKKDQTKPNKDNNHKKDNSQKIVNGSITMDGQPEARGAESFPVFTSPVNTKTVKTVPAKQAVPISGKASVNGSEWFQLADRSGWIRASEVAVTGYRVLPTVNPFKENNGNKGNQKPVDNNQKLPVAPNGSHRNDNQAPAKTTPTFTLPAGYKDVPWGTAHNNEGLRNAEVPQYASMLRQGFNSNNYRSDDSRRVNVRNLTPSQKSELTQFALTTINNARAAYGVPAWRASSQAQTIADQVAANYLADNWNGIQNSHDVSAIVRACQANGLNFKNNYVEDMGFFLNPNPNVTMGYLKEQIYFNIKQMLFGGMGSANDNPREMQHARQLLSPEGSEFGFSISYQHGFGSDHYINISDRYREMLTHVPQGF